MKNKGYTLLELLGVIVILSVLVTLVFPSVINFIKKGNDKIDSITNELIINAAEDYINDNLSNLYLTSGEKICVSIEALIEGKYLDKKNIVEDLYNTKSVKVTYNNKINYEVIDSKECPICKLVSGSPNAVGSKYQCKVKDEMEEGFENGYYFYVLSSEANGTTNLIMERNIYYNEDAGTGSVATESNKGLVAWLSKDDYKTNGGTNFDQFTDGGACELGNICAMNYLGPLTSMTYLYNATKDWTNIEPLNYTYKDKEELGTTTENTSYTSFVSTNGIGVITALDEAIKNTVGTSDIPLRARMPKYSEVQGVNKCTTTFGSCPLWLSNYLSSSSYVTGEGLQNINGIYGYLTLSSNIDTPSSVSLVYFIGGMHNLGVSDERNGVRPVINLKL